MQNLFFLGIILVGKEKIPNKSTKTIQKQKPKKKIKASHFAVETVEQAWQGQRPGRAGAEGALKAAQAEPQRSGAAGAAARCQKGKGFGCFLQ